MLYFVSPYYKKSVYTGANKRFDELGREILGLIGDNFRIVICEGEKPHWAPEAICLYVRPYRSKRERLQSFYSLHKLLASQEPATVVSDFMPIPLSALRRHHHFQLIYDLRNFTEFKRGGLSILTSGFQRSQLRRSERIVTISEHSKRDLIRLCGIAPEEIVVSYCGIGEEYLRARSPEERDFDLFYVATFEERKNHRRLMQALELSPHALNVCLVGHDLGIRDEIMQLADTLTRNKGHRFDFVSSLDEGALIDYYNCAKVYVFPSLLEGFGIPLIEALASNCRVACSDLPVFHEICGEWAEYFDARDPGNIWAIIAKSLEDWEHRNSSEFARQFLWKNIAEKLLSDLGCSELRQSSNQ